jgi:CubicO group peptidase (beta-lactamase class C family)
MIQSLLDRHVETGAIAGAVALVGGGDEATVFTAGSQDLESGAKMRRDTIFRIMSMTKPITAAAAMILVEDGRIALDDPVERWLPELAARRVLRTPDSALDDTVPAARPIVVEDLLTLRLGLGWVQDGAVGREMQALGVAPGPDPVPFTPDEFMERIGRLPLASQPGERWLYHTGADILAVLIARAAGTALPEFLQERLFAPLGMQDTGFYVPSAKLARLATGYSRAKEGGLVVSDPAVGGAYAAPPLFPSELVSTADDYLRFARMLLRGGDSGGVRVLSADSVRRMMQDRITPEQKAASPFFPGFWDDKGWGYGAAVVTRETACGPKPGSYGWDGGYGTSMTIDPEADRIVILLLQRLMTGPDDVAIAAELRRIAYAEQPEPIGEHA